MRKLFIVSFLLSLIIHVQLSAKEVTFLQYLYTIKQIFPDLTECSVLIDKSMVDAQKSKLERASAQMKVKVVVYPVKNNKDIGKSMKEVRDNSVLILFSSSLFENKSTKLFVLSKSKEKKIALVTSSKEYVDAGALIGLLPNEKNKTDLVVNLKHSQYLAAKFTEDFVKTAGIKTVIQ